MCSYLEAPVLYWARKLFGRRSRISWHSVQNWVPITQDSFFNISIQSKYVPDQSNQLPAGMQSWCVPAEYWKPAVSRSSLTFIRLSKELWYTQSPKLQLSMDHIRQWKAMHFHNCTYYGTDDCYFTFLLVFFFFQNCLHWVKLWGF